MHDYVAHTVRLALAQLNLVGVHHKSLIPNYGVLDEICYSQAGNSAQFFSLDGVTFGKDTPLPITNKYQEWKLPLLVGEGWGEVGRTEERN